MSELVVPAELYSSVFALLVTAKAQMNPMFSKASMTTPTTTS
jgi:hypothetical protein